jgi:hypothetical protein
MGFWSFKDSLLAFTWALSLDNLLAFTWVLEFKDSFLAV